MNHVIITLFIAFALIALALGAEGRSWWQMRWWNYVAQGFWATVALAIVLLTLFGGVILLFAK